MLLLLRLLLLLLLAAPGCAAARAVKPNIIFVLTDDEDTVLGGDSARAMPSGLPALSARGATATNWFVHTPVCAASRAEILTGRFFHNLADVPSAADPWDVRGNTCGPCFAGRPATRGCGKCAAPGRNMHLNFSRFSPGPTFAQHLAQSDAGYAVGVFGKYLNRVPMTAGGRPVVPAGVSRWFVSPGDEADKATAADPSGEYVPSFYYDNASPDGSGVWNNSAGEYETAFLSNRSLAWVRETVAANASRPFFLYLAPHAPHGLAIPAPWYADLAVSDTAPRTPSWNASCPDHHWLIAQQPPLSVPEARTLDKQFQRRWRCLRAVDDLLGALDATLAELGLWENTYLFFSSDHGYHFGEFRLGGGKWQVYDTDVRVPMRIAGPTIRPNSTLGLVGSHVDLAPTWLGLAGVGTPDGMDGRSLAGVLLGHAEEQAAGGGRAALAGDGKGALPAGGAYIEYHGLGPTGASSPPWYRQQDALNNTYRALRVIDRRPGGLGNVLYAEFGTFGFGEVFSREFFEMDSDPWQVHNVYGALPPAVQAHWASRVASLFNCSGAACRM